MPPCWLIYDALYASHPPPLKPTISVARQEFLLLFMMSLFARQRKHMILFLSTTYFYVMGLGADSLQPPISVPIEEFLL